MSRLRAEIIQDPGMFEKLEAPWWRLWSQSASATPFQSPAWLIPWWQTFAPGDLAAIAVWNGDDLAGLAPLYLERHDCGPRLLPIGISLSDYLDILCAPQLEAEATAAIADAALSLEWSQWILPDLAADAVSLSLVLPSAEERRSTAHATCPVLLLKGDQTLAYSVPARRRRQLRRAARAARRRGPVVVRHVESDPQTFLDRLVRLHEARWADKGGGVLSNMAVEFHRRALPRLAGSGLARCLTIEIGNVVVGAYYGFHHRDRAYAYLGGFDPAYADESPGAILIGHAITAAAEEGAREFDFLRGGEGYKYGWGANDRWTARTVWTRSAPL
ncbi:Acetyltransferase involved in cellulose biosynthesis, CelD/BcsL family [Mesorhizobium sp. NFR06]|uniref:GNAT family N-acetyltransferase n=1 Tax=Mesorhizobium sp. NFR06 TaxID=1566290 RepID=UPI0008E26B0F|nr:GNAT family N-acetyltransferase [Mesorhizobium sp. NFR06]SFQ07460.1 Acetyltransferase involved in cellulose biosynthesis, CelD/BcsL family [Mesorhizobium sp. NFR06]